MPVINGTVATSIETNRARQLSLLAWLAFPKSRVVNHTLQISKAAAQVRFPLVVKVNIGGAGAGYEIRRGRLLDCASYGRGGEARN